MSKHETEEERKKREAREAAARRKALGSGQVGRAADKLKAREKKMSAFWDSL